MPFQSEKQRKYLWANEPEIAREWTDKYGSRVKKDNGGIMDAWGRQGLRYPQSQDLEAQASGMFKEEDEDENFIDRMRKYTMPAYNFMRGKVGAGLMGLMNPLAGLTMFAGGKNLRNSAAYRPATQGAYKYSPAQLNRMNALGGYYSEPARQQRRTQSRIDNMMARKAAGKSYSQKNLNKLTMNQGPAGQGGGNQGGGNQGGGGFGKGNDPGGGAAGSPFNRGGLASLWQR